MRCITISEGILPRTGDFEHPVCRREDRFCIRAGEYIGAGINGFRSFGILPQSHARH